MVLKKRRLQILFKNVTKKYHLECESKKYDGSILVRIFEYDTQIAIDDSKGSVGKLHIKFPNTGLLLLRKTDNNIPFAKVQIELPNQRCVAYSIPIIHMSDYSIDDIFDNKLYMLIPFYIFNYEKELAGYNADEKKAEMFLEGYNSIYGRLLNELEAGSLSPLSFSAIIRLTYSVAYKLTVKHSNLQKKVSDIMGGKVLDLPEIRVYHQGKEEGRAEGEKERNELKEEVERLRKELEQYKTASSKQ